MKKVRKSSCFFFCVKICDFLMQFLGIVHSDLKPANFLLVGGNLKLIDFGISSSIPTNRTSVIKDTQMGTLSFMPPEAVAGSTGSLHGGKEVYKVKFGLFLCFLDLWLEKIKDSTYLW